MNLLTPSLKMFENLIVLFLELRGQKQVIMFEPHNNKRMYEGHIPQATLGYNTILKKFRRKNLEDTTSMVMSPVDILQPDFQVRGKICH